MILFKRLRSYTSLIEKQNLLSSSATATDKKVFEYAYSPFKTYKLKFNDVDYDTVEYCPPTEMFGILDSILAGFISGSKARAAVQEFADKHGDLIKLICNKDLDCGVSATTLNTVFGQGFIPTFNIQLAKEQDVESLIYPVLGQLKYNGARVVTLIEEGKISFFSRGGHQFYFEELRLALKGLDTQELMLDGELTFGDSKDTDHTAVSGLVNSSIKTGTTIKSEGLRYNIFDAMVLHEFKENKCFKPYEQRLHLVNLAVDMCSSPMIVVADTQTFNSPEEVQRHYNHLLSQGYEGMILKRPNHPYTFKKNANWVKLKATDTADLTCVDIAIGTGKYDGMIGALICVGEVGGYAVEVGVGSGLTDAQRALHSSTYVGNCIEVKYNKVIKDTTTGKYSLFLPRFVSVRKDKS